MDETIMPVWSILIRPYILKRDNNKCILCGSIKHLIVHHKNYDNQNLDNLITLCSKCHRKVHLNKEVRYK